MFLNYDIQYLNYVKILLRNRCYESMITNLFKKFFDLIWVWDKDYLQNDITSKHIFYLFIRKFHKFKQYIDYSWKIVALNIQSIFLPNG